MICFEVSRNGEVLCVAGIGERGGLHVITSWVHRALDAAALERHPDAGGQELRLDVSGLHPGPQGEHVDWAKIALELGDHLKPS